MIRDKQLDSLTIMGFLNDGEVDFKNSDTKSTPCKTYLIESEVNDVLAKMTVQNCPDSAVVQNVRF